MFTNRSANELNIRVVFYGPGLVGKTMLMQHIYDTTPEDQKGKMFSLQTETERTIFYDLQRPDFPKIEGARLRLHLYTLSGQVFYAASAKLILKNVDAVVFVADSQQERQEADIAAFEELQVNLSEQGLSLERVPHVLCVTKGDLENAETLGGVLSNLGSQAHGLSVNGRTGHGVSELMGRLVAEVQRAVVEGRLNESQPTAEEKQVGSSRHEPGLSGTTVSISASRRASTTRRKRLRTGQALSWSSTSRSLVAPSGRTPRLGSAYGSNVPMAPRPGSSFSRTRQRRARRWPMSSWSSRGRSICSMRPTWPTKPSIR